MAKNDRRVRYTKQTIRTALFELLKTKTLEQITVKELCQKADINRATFYSHYETLGALMEEVEYEECKPLFDMLDDVLMDDNHLYHSTTIMIAFLKDHPIMREVFLSKATVGKGLSKLTWEHLNKTHTAMVATGQVSDEEAYWMLSFIVYGMREMLRNWFESDMEHEQAFVQTISHFIRYGINGFLAPDFIKSSPHSPNF